jgi:SAM-dependent methyltransferase
MLLSKIKATYDAHCDRRLQIETAGEIRPPDTSKFQDALKFGSLAYPLVSKYLDVLGLRQDDVFFDLGCGAGRIICLASLRASRCVGIEMDPALADRARNNARMLRPAHGDIDIRTQDAALADYAAATVIWLSNPFGPKTLIEVLARIRDSIRNEPRQVRFCYIQSDKDFSVFQDQSWLTLDRSIRPIIYPAGPATFWHSNNLA